MSQLTPEFIAKLQALQPLAKEALRRLHPTVLEPCGEYREVPMRFCRKCGEEWPETEEFFYRSNGGFHAPCIACIQEQKQQMHATTPCAYPGCPNPPHRGPTGKYTSYCEDHLWHKQKRAARTQRSQRVQA